MSLNRRPIAKMKKRISLVLLVSMLLNVLLALVPAATVFADANDSPNYATVITPNNSIQGDIDPQYDVDFFQFSSPVSGGAVTISLSVPSSKDYDLFVYNSLTSALNNAASYSSTKATGLTESITISSTMVTTYYVKVIGYNGANSTEKYTLNVSSISSPDNNEPNNSDTQAATISPGSFVDSYISSSTDFDIWRFTTGASSFGTVNVQMTVPSGVDYELQVYQGSTSGTLVGSSYKGAGVTESVDVTISSSTTYYIKIYKASGSSYSSTPYRLSVSALPVDNYEPNNSDGQAAGVSPGTPLNSYISSNSDFDIWKFATASINMGTLNVRMMVPSGVDYELQVYQGSTSGTLVGSSYNGSGATEITDVTVIPNTTYYVKVYKAGGSGFSTSPYQLTVEALPIDNNEANNTDVQATAITPGSYVDSYISYNADGDTWKFATGASNAGMMTAQLAVPAGVDYELQVYESSTSGTELKGSYNNGLGLAESISFDVVPSRNYYLKVYSKGNLYRSVTSYRLTLGALPTVVDNNEPNNTDGDAKAIAPGSYVDSYISYNMDGDIWKFTTGTSNIGTMSANLTVPAGVDYELQVYENSTSGTELQGSYTAGLGAAESVSFAIKPSKTYFLKVYSKGNQYRSTSSYRLTLGGMPQAPDNNEPNETSANAKTITPGIPLISYISTDTDYDVWKFTTGAGNSGSITVGMTVPAGVDYDFQIYDGSLADAALVATADQRGSTAESLTILVGSGKTYYVKVYNASRPVFSTSAYTLTLGNLPLDNNEPNNTDGDAKAIVPGSYVDSYISYNTDGDIWKFTTGTSNIGTMSANLTVPAGVDYELQVYENSTSGTELQGSYTAGLGAAESVSFAIKPSKTYFLKVYSKGNQYRSTSSYRLTLGGMPQAPDNNEPNDKIDDAKPVTPGTPLTSYISTETDFDIWTFTTGAGNSGSIKVDMTVPSGIDYDFQIYGESLADSALLATAENGGSTPESQTVVLSAGKTYYVKVYNSSKPLFSILPYTLTVGALPVDDNEPNNTDADAKVISPGSFVNSYISYLKDGDVWKFKAGAYNSGMASAQLTMPGNVNYELQVYEESTQVPELTGSYNGGSQPERVNFEIVPGRTYYLKVYSKDNLYYSPAAYKLTLDSLPTVLDNNELNNKDEDATSFTPGTTVSSYISYNKDGDIWRFQTGRSNIGTMNIQLNVPSGVDYELQLYDGSTSGQELKGSYTSSTFGSVEAISFDAKPNKTYYIKVYSKQNLYHSTTPYTLKVDPLPVALDNYEENNTDGQATLINPGASINSYISYDTDGDIFTFTTDGLTVGGMNFQLESPDGADYDFQVYKQSTTNDSNKVGEATDTNKKSSIDVNVIPSTTYFVKVYKGGNVFVPRSYTLSVSALPHDSELNDSEAGAKFMPPSAVQKSYLYQAGDVDYWKYKTGPLESGNRVFVLKSPAAFDYELQVYPEGKYDTSEMKGSYNASGQLEVVNMQVKPNTTYVMKIYGALGKSLPVQFSYNDPYTLSVGTDQYGESPTGPDPNAVDSFEVNDTEDTAVPIDGGRTIRSYIFYEGDVDYYRFKTSSSPGEVSLSLDVPVSQDYELRVCQGTGGTTCWASELPRGQDEALIIPLLANMTYYIRIEGAIKGSGGRYFGTAPEDAYVLMLGSLPAPVSEQWDFSDVLLTKPKWDTAKFGDGSGWVSTAWDDVDAKQADLAALQEYWAGQSAFLQGAMVDTSNPGLQSWAEDRYYWENQRVYLIKVTIVGTEDEQSWANSRLFIINNILYGNENEQAWARDYMDWQSQYDYYYGLVHDPASSSGTVSWATERLNLVNTIRSTSGPARDAAIDRLHWLNIEDYMLGLIANNPNSGLSAWAQTRENVVSKILSGNAEERATALNRWSLLEMLDNGTEAEKEQARRELAAMDASYEQTSKPRSGTSESLGGCTSSSCRQVVDDIGNAAFNEEMARLNYVLQSCIAASGGQAEAGCREYVESLKGKQDTEYTPSEQSQTVSGVVARVDALPASSTNWDFSSLTAHFLQGLLEGFKGVFTGLWDSLKALWHMLSHWSEAYDALKQFIQPFIDLVQGKAGWKEILNLVSPGLGDTIEELWNNRNNPNEEAETIGTTIGQLLGNLTMNAIAGVAGNALKKLTEVSDKAKALEKRLDDLAALIPCNCFTAGTKVLTRDGEKSIEQVQLGDYVLAKNPDTGEMAYKEVDLLFQKDITESWNITVGEELITTTDEHPFWIKDKGWVVAKDLVVGDLFETSDGSHLSVDKIEIREQHTTVYNFRVKDFHTYYVSNLKILTHNSNCPNYNSLTSGKTSELATSGSPSKRLGVGLELVGIPKPQPPYKSPVVDWQAHHIVPEKATKYPAGARANAIISKYNIEVNSPANGVWLPKTDNRTASTYVDWAETTMATHNGSHIESYYEYVAAMLEKAERDAIAEGLSKPEIGKAVERKIQVVREQLMSGAIVLHGYGQDVPFPPVQ